MLPEEDRTIDRLLMVLIVVATALWVGWLVAQR